MLIGFALPLPTLFPGVWSFVECEFCAKIAMPLVYATSAHHLRPMPRLKPVASLMTHHYGYLSVVSIFPNYVVFLLRGAAFLLSVRSAGEKVNQN